MASLPVSPSRVTHLVQCSRSYTRASLCPNKSWLRRQSQTRAVSVGSECRHSIWAATFWAHSSTTARLCLQFWLCQSPVGTVRVSPAIMGGDEKQPEWGQGGKTVPEPKLDRRCSWKWAGAGQPMLLKWSWPVPPKQSQLTHWMGRRNKSRWELGLQSRTAQAAVPPCHALAV